MEELVNGLHAFPIIQLVVAAVIAIGGTAAWLRGERDRRQTPDYGSPAVQMFFDGPLVKALDLLQGIYRVLLEMRLDAQRFADENNRKSDERITILREQVMLLRELRDRQTRRH